MGNTNQTNMNLRVEMMLTGLKHYQVAELLGISEWTLSRRLRKELPAEEQQRIISIIRNSKEQKTE